MFSSYRAVNTSHLGHKSDHLILYRKVIAFYTVWMLNLVALEVTIGLSKVKEVSHYYAYLPELGEDGY